MGVYRIKFNVYVVGQRKLIELNSQSVDFTVFKVEYGMAGLDAHNPIVISRLDDFFRCQG